MNLVEIQRFKEGDISWSHLTDIIEIMNLFLVDIGYSV